MTPTTDEHDRDLTTGLDHFGPATTRYFIGVTGGLHIATSIGPAQWKGEAMPVPLSAFGHGAASVGEILAAESPMLYPVSEEIWREWSADYPEDDAADRVAQLWRAGDPAARAALAEQPGRWPELVAALDDLVAARDAAAARSMAEASASADGPQ